jgi:hypothetical protein
MFLLPMASPPLRSPSYGPESIQCFPIPLSSDASADPQASRPSSQTGGAAKTKSGKPKMAIFSDFNVSPAHGFASTSFSFLRSRIDPMLSHPFVDPPAKMNPFAPSDASADPQASRPSSQTGGAAKTKSGKPILLPMASPPLRSPSYGPESIQCFPIPLSIHQLRDSGTR